MSARPFAACLLIAELACGGRPDPGEAIPPAPRASIKASTPYDAAPPTPPRPARRDAAPAPPRRAIVAVAAPEALAAVAAAGGRFADLVPPEAYRDIAATIRADVAAIGRGDPRAGVGIRGNAHRLLDTGWLTQGRFELVGVVFRIDRAALTPEACGDVRLLYRLAYEIESGGATIGSRLPMTVAVVLAGPERTAGSCRQAAARWLAPAGAGGARLGAWLVGEDGPLAGALSPRRVTRVLTNLQAVRWPSAVHPDLGGHAEYTLRAFDADGDGGFEPASLEAVPDTERIRRRPALRRRLLAWLRAPETARAADRGEVRLPEPLRARLSVTVTPRGFSRRANRPYRSLIDPAELEGLELDALPRAGSPEALLRRLDEQTCAGCHQARTVAGFHFLGADPEGLPPGNGLAVFWSAHFEAELARRRQILEALAAGETPDLAPPPAERAPGEGGGHGARCGLGDPGFSNWTCQSGLTCHPYDAPEDDRAVGMCVPEGVAGIGDPCEVGALTARSDPRRDRVRDEKRRPCADGLVCKGNEKGFPGGLCAAETCADLPEGAACAVIAGEGFDRCLAESPFPRCIRENVRPLGVRACDHEVPCRDDYVCARTREGGGACVPPYFLFQLRVDGHPRAP